MTEDNTAGGEPRLRMEFWVCGIRAKWGFAYARAVLENGNDWEWGSPVHNVVDEEGFTVEVRQRATRAARHALTAFLLKDGAERRQAWETAHDARAII